MRYHVIASECRRNLKLLRESELTLDQVIERVLLLVKFADGEPEDDPSDTRQDGDGRIVPYEQRIDGQRYSESKKLDTSWPIANVALRDD